MKKIAAIILACSLLTTSLFCGIEVTADPVDTYFTDIKGHWAEQTLLEMVEDGLIIGRTETEFDPDAFVTSAEFVTMCIRVQGGAKFLGDRKTFQDVNHGDWFYQDIETAVDRGLVKPADYFIPNEPITRERMATIAYRAYGKDEISSELSFIDADEIADYAKEPVAKAVQAGLIQGMDDGTFLPKAGTTRAQAAVVINRLHQKTAESPLHRQNQVHLQYQVYHLPLLQSQAVAEEAAEVAVVEELYLQHPVRRYSRVLLLYRLNALKYQLHPRHHQVLSHPFCQRYQLLVSRSLIFVTFIETNGTGAASRDRYMKSRDSNIKARQPILIKQERLRPME